MPKLFVCPPVPKASDPPSNMTWEDSIMPPPLKLTRTFSTYGIPSFERTVNYLLEGGEVPSMTDLCEGVPELNAQLSRKGFHFMNEQWSRWIDMKILVYGNSL
jgi:hypothetical protein